MADSDPHKNLRSKNYALFAVLLALVALFYSLAVMKMGGTL